MNFDKITETQTFWHCFRKIPELHDICHTSLDDVTDALEAYRDNLHAIPTDTMTPNGGGDIGELFGAAQEALSHSRVAIIAIKSVQSLVEEIKEMEGI